MKNKRKILTFFVLLVFSPLLVFGDNSTLPLIQESDLQYLGAFALPNTTINETRLGYGGSGLGSYHDPNTGKNSLFIGANVNYGNGGYVGQVEIPNSFTISNNWNELQLGTILQGFYDITDGNMSTLGADSYNRIYGFLVYNNRLIIGASRWYDASCSQNASHGISSLNLSVPNDFQGFYSLDAVAIPRALGGYMTTVPDEWINDFGGPALTGNSAMSIAICKSSGPAVSVFDPDDLGIENPVPATTLSYYPLDNYLTSGGITTYNTWMVGSAARGIAFPADTRSIIFIGEQALGTEYCYGPGTDDPDLHLVPITDDTTWCYDPCNSDKGGHGYPYVHYIWAYDANELLEVKSGLKQPWEVKPYAEWALGDMNSDGCATIRSAGFDSQTNKLYITQEYEEHPRVDVYQIGISPDPVCGDGYCNGDELISSCPADCQNESPNSPTGLSVL